MHDFMRVYRNASRRIGIHFKQLQASQNKLFSSPLILTTITANLPFSLCAPVADTKQRYGHGDCAPLRNHVRPGQSKEEVNWTSHVF
jgi:hypothetical protein